MADERQVCFEAPDEIAAEDLCVIKIELNAQIGAADLGDDIGGLLDAIEEIAGRSRRVERLDQEGYPGRFCFSRCFCKYS